MLPPRLLLLPLLLVVLAMPPISAAPVPEPVATVCGDIDLDDQFSESDPPILRTHLAGLDTGALDLEAGPSAERCNVDGDDTCGLVDWVRALRFLEGAAGGPFDLCTNTLLAPGVTADPGPFNVSGTVTSASGQTVDLDVNDVNTFPLSNNVSPQFIPVPIAVGGYANNPGFGALGNSFFSGDPIDLYRAFLLEGQVIRLVVGDHAANADLDLLLFTVFDPFNPVDVSLSADPVEEIVVPFSGEFVITVRTFNNLLDHQASNYVLSVGQALAPSAGAFLRLSDDFVPGQIVVHAQLGTGGAAGALAPARAFEPSFGLRALAGAADHGMLFELPEGEPGTAAAFETLGSAEPRAALRASLVGVDPELQRRIDTLLAVKVLRTRPDVVAADPNYIGQPGVAPDDPEYGPQRWHYEMINAPQAWDETTGDPDVIVAVIDTGILKNHPDMQGQLVPGFDFVSDPENARDGDGIDPDPEDPGTLDRGGTSSTFHGTHVAGTIGARTNNGVGVAGVAWDLGIMPIRNLGKNGGNVFDLNQSVLFAAQLPNVSGTLPARPADIVNMSLQNFPRSQTTELVMAQARAQGLILIACAGNSNSPQPSYPSSYPGVVSVSALDINKQRAPYSNFGRFIDVAAPGGDMSRDLNGDGIVDGVMSTMGADGNGPLRFVYDVLQGTSMASPHVAGVAALMKARDPDLTPDQFDALLASGQMTEDLGALGRDDIYGYGLIDARAGVAAVTQEPSEAPGVLSIRPTALNFAADLSQASIEARNAGDGPLAITGIFENSGGWLSFAASDTDSNGLGTYSVSVDRTGLAAGTYVATLSFSSTAGVFNLGVVMSVPVTGNFGFDAGFHYVLLVDPNSFETIAQDNVAPVNGSYAFEFPAVPPGEYFLVGGTDLDNDGILCDRGEACAIYPTEELSLPVRVDQDLAGLTFVTRFPTQVGGAAATAGELPRPERREYRLLKPERAPKTIQPPER